MRMESDLSSRPLSASAASVSTYPGTELSVRVGDLDPYTSERGLPQKLVAPGLASNAQSGKDLGFSLMDTSVGPDWSGAGDSTEDGLGVGQSRSQMESLSREMPS